MALPGCATARKVPHDEGRGGNPRLYPPATFNRDPTGSASAADGPALPVGSRLNDAAVEVVRLRHLVEFNGSQEQPVRFVTLRGFTFRHAARTFLDTREPLLRSDWTIYRGGAVVFNGAEDCGLTDCEFDQVGGNTIFMNNYNRRVLVRGCYIHDSGGNGVALVGDPKAVRNPLFEYNQRQDYASIDKTPGPQSDNYPAECTVEDCLITRIGRVEKQAAGVQIGGVHLADVPAGSLAARTGFRTDDLIQGLSGQPVRRVSDLFRLQDAAAGQPLAVTVVRAQQPQVVTVEAYPFKSCPRREGESR